MPKSEPHDTWVVETGRFSLDAPITRSAVSALAVKPWPGFMSVTRCAIVSATRLAHMPCFNYDACDATKVPIRVDCPEGR